MGTYKKGGGGLPIWKTELHYESREGKDAI